VDALDEAEALLVPSEDAGALAQAMLQSLSDRPSAEARSRRAAARLARDFGVERWLDRYEQVYRSVTGPGSK
jgi:glycosyltransferase involved in cell wall biosynthesis